MGESMAQQADFRTLDKSLRVQRIIDTAVELFHQKGYRSTTLEDVANELGITKAALYHYVSSKEQLLSIIYIQALENIFRNMDEILSRGLPPRETLRMILENHIQGIIIESLSMFSVFFTEENQLPEQEFRRIQREKRKYTEIVQEVIQEGVRQGAFRPVDPTLQAYAVIGMCNWIYKWYRPGHSPYAPEEIAGHFVALLEQGYLAEGGSLDAAASEARTAGGSPELYRRLRRRCRELITLLDELDPPPPA